MSASLYYVLLAVAVGIVIVFFVRYLRLALRLVLTLGKLAVAALLVLLVGWALGLWNLPRPLVTLFFGMRRLWQPFQVSLLEWIHSLLR